MSLSYTVGSNTRTGRSSNNQRRNNLTKNTASTRQVPLLHRRECVVVGGESQYAQHQQNNSNKPANLQHRRSSSYSKSEKGQTRFSSRSREHEPRIVTLSDLNISESSPRPSGTVTGTKGGKLTKSNQQSSKTRKVLPSNISNRNSTFSYTSRTTSGTDQPGHSRTSKNSSSNMAAYSPPSSHYPNRRPPVSSSGRPVGRPTYRDMPPQPAPGATEQGRPPRPGEAVYNPQGNYTLIHPNQAKRTKMQNQAAKGEASYKKYKEQRRVGHVSITPATVGGRGKCEDEVRRKMQREQETKKYEMIRKREQWDREKKEREDREYAEKKAKARNQTELNRRRAIEEEGRRQTNMHRDHQRANEAFLRRFEHKQNAMMKDPYS